MSVGSAASRRRAPRAAGQAAVAAVQHQAAGQLGRGVEVLPVVEAVEVLDHQHLLDGGELQAGQRHAQAQLGRERRQRRGQGALDQHEAVVGALGRDLVVDETQAGGLPACAGGRCNQQVDAAGLLGGLAQAAQHRLAEVQAPAARLADFQLHVDLSPQRAELHAALAAAQQVVDRLPVACAEPGQASHRRTSRTIKLPEYTGSGSPRASSSKCCLCSSGSPS